MPPERTPLSERLERAGLRYSIAGTKPEDLSFDQIVDRVATFMIEQEKLRVAFAFGNEVGEELEDPADTRFDPQALFAAEPEQLDQICMYVDWELCENETELLRRKDNNIFAYNTLVFGAAIRIARSEKMSKDLRAFLVDHLVKPSPPSVSKPKGRPKASTEDKEFKLNAIQFAMDHGLSALRNDATTAHTSACDAVSQAAIAIYQSEDDQRFGSGYSFEHLKTLWKKRPRAK